MTYTPSPQQMQLLDFIRQHPGATIENLASVLKDCKPYTRNMLDRLVLKGFLRKEHVQRRVVGFNSKKHHVNVNSYFITEEQPCAD